MKKTEISKKLSSLKKELNDAQLVAVSKYSTVEDVVLAYECHHYDFGENRVQDLKEKTDFFFANNFKKVRWHFIGHLQTNKVRDLLKCQNLWAVHSIDSLRLLEEFLKRETDFLGNELKLFFQVNTSHETEKSGFESSEELLLAIKLLLSNPQSKYKLYGLMTMGTVRTDAFEEEARRCFKDLNRIARGLEEQLGLKFKLKLSMGMSQDYQIALAEGTDFVRIGSAIFK